VIEKLTAHIIFLYIIIVFLIALFIVGYADIRERDLNNLNVSRFREELLLKEVKLLDYQIDILTNEFINK
jgi:hypothetical protein